MFEKSSLISDLCEHGYHIIDNLLPKDVFDQIRTLVLQTHMQGNFQPAKVGQNQHTKEVKAIRNDETYWLDPQRDAVSYMAYFNHINELIQVLNQELFLGLNDHELHLAAYATGSFYKKHSDRFVGTSARRISCVYYLNQNWEEEYGGALNLFDEEDTLLTQCFPQGNRFICFKSELPHEVCPTLMPRYSITGWLKRSPILSF